MNSLRKIPNQKVCHCAHFGDGKHDRDNEYVSKHGRDNDCGVQGIDKTLEQGWVGERGERQ